MMGPTGGGTVAWMNVFAVDSSKDIITGIETCFGTPVFPSQAGVTAGQAFQVHLWGSGADPSLGMTYLGSWGGTVSAGSIDSDVLQTVAIAPTSVGAYSHFVIGASVDHPAGGFPAPIDQLTVLPGVSWVAGSTVAGGWDPANPEAGGIGFFELGSIGFPGTWLLRAQAIPAPGAVALLGVVGLVGTRRRR